MTPHGPDDTSGRDGIDTTVPHSARIWNHWLGGKDNYPIDRAAGDAYIKQFPGIVNYVVADAGDPELVVRRVGGTLDFGRPVAVMMLGILGHLPETDQARGLVDWWAHFLVEGSYVAICDGIEATAGRGAAQAAYNATGAAAYVLREPEQIAGFFTGLELVDPDPDGPGSGVVAPNLWRPEHPEVNSGAPVEARAGVGRVA